jgi:hypothetical protein
MRRGCVTGVPLLLRPVDRSSALPALGALLTRQRDYTRAVERATGQVVRWVFHRQGQPIKYFRRAWEAACIAVGFVRVDPTTTTTRATKLFHDFRRTAVRNWSARASADPSR